MSDEGGRVLQSQFLFDVAPMDIHSFWADEKLHGNVPRAPALTDEPKDIELPVAEFLDRRIGPTRAAAREGVEQLSRQSFADLNLPHQHLTNSREQFLGTCFLHDIAAGTGGQDTFGINELIVHGDDENRQVRMER